MARSLGAAGLARGRALLGVALGRRLLLVPQLCRLAGIATLWRHREPRSLRVCLRGQCAGHGASGAGMTPPAGLIRATIRAEK